MKRVVGADGTVPVLLNAEVDYLLLVLTELVLLQQCLSGALVDFLHLRNVLSGEILMLEYLANTSLQA